MGLSPDPYWRGPRHHRQLAESGLGFSLPEVQRVGALFKQVVTRARQHYSLTALLAQPADALLLPGPDGVPRPGLTPRKVPRDSVFPTTAGLLRFCLAYYRPPLANGQRPRQADLQKDYGLTQAQVSQWLRLGRRGLLTVLEHLAAAPDEPTRELVAKVRALHPALNPSGGPEGKFTG